VIQLVISAPGEVRLEDGALPEPAPGELRVRAESVGICGSDLHALAGAHPFIELPVPLHHVQDRELRLQGTAMYVREDVTRAMELVAGGTVPAARLVTHEFARADGPNAFRAAGEAAVKVHLHPQR
jgi:threonine dehydrogenase-like Zn-dependent dehydrogenase